MEPPSETQDAITRVVRVLLALRQGQQKDLVDVLGVNATGVTRRMKKGTWTIQDLDAMARYFGVPVATFFEDPRTHFDQDKPSTACITDFAELADVTVR